MNENVLELSRIRSVVNPVMRKGILTRVSGVSESSGATDRRPKALLGWDPSVV